jgi:ABC-type transport system involved in cytochrome c biogenesis permease subunit
MDVASLVGLRAVAALLYAAAAIAYLSTLGAGGAKRPIVPTLLLCFALALHGLEYAGRGAAAGQAGGAPFTGISGFLSLVVLVLVASYLLLETKLSSRALGAFLVPPSAFLHICSALLYQQPERVPQTLRGAHLVAHVSSMTLAYVGFTVALISGCTYLMLDALLRRKRPGTLFRRLPNLELMTKVHRVSLMAGAGLLVVGALTGALWAKPVWGFYFSWQEPKMVITLCAVLATSACALLWRTQFWRGRRVTWLSISVILAMFAAMALAGTLSSELHRFA